MKLKTLIVKNFSLAKLSVVDFGACTNGSAFGYEARSSVTMPVLVGLEELQKFFNYAGWKKGCEMRYDTGVKTARSLGDMRTHDEASRVSVWVCVWKLRDAS